MSTQTHTLREKGQALFLAALMVLSVFAMSASFAGAVAADATGVTAENVDLADGSEATINVSHDDGDGEVYAVISQDATYNEGDDILESETENVDDGSTELPADVSGLDGEYTVYAIATDGTLDAPTEGEDLTQWSQANTTFTVSDSSNGDISGTATDAAGDGIEGATVSVEGTDLSATTAADGSYTIENAPNGEHTLVVSADGYENGSQMVTVENGNDVTADVTLGLAAPDDADAVAEDNMTYWQGQDVFFEAADGSNSADQTYQIRTDDGDDRLVTEFVLGEDGTAVISTSGLDGNYKIVDENGDVAVDNMEVAVQDLDAQFDSDSVVNGDEDSESTLELDSNRGSYDVEVTSEGLSQSDLETIFGDSVVTSTDDGVVLSSSDTSANFSGIDAGEYNVTVEATDTDAEANATVEVTDAGEDTAQFDSSTYSEEAGDIVEFTVELEGGANQATVNLTEGDENYNATVEVTDGNDDGEVTVYFNTYNAGQDGDTFYVADDSEDSVKSTETSLEGYRLLPADFNLELSVNGEETDLATLVLNDGSTGEIDTAVAPAGADLTSDVSALENATTAGSDVADGDQVVIGVDVSGVFGQLANGDFDSSDLNLTIEQSNPDRYTSANTIENFEVVKDAENNRIYFVVDTTNENIDAGQEYDVTFTVSEDYVNSYSEDDDNDAEEATTNFSVTERKVEVTGDFNDDGVLQVENDENATITGESNAAPGTDVQIRLRATGDDPFLMSQTAEVGEDGAIDSTFDLSEYEAGQNFTVRMTDNNGEEDVQHQVDATLVESSGDHEPHPVTVTVEDSEGNAVSGADVTVDGQTKTTNDDGEVTFELAHGEYDVSASHDGQEASGTITVGDDASDSGTLTLGEEDAGEINDPSEGDDKNGDDNKDDKNKDDNKNNGGDGSDGNNDGGDGSNDNGEDQPGFGIAVALIALLAAAGIALRNRA
ncbi:MAG: carboxypeptidase regulatory-like domain-containing protein [Halalkalicoccus sp.]|nr:carboxypeptidase regulatory-like domain-containing protein [Halalkalicoccus sp.]